MGRERSIGRDGPENTVISYRAARTAARELRGRGWAITAGMCRGSTPAKVARVLKGELPCKQLTREIAAMIGLVPEGEGVE